MLNHKLNYFFIVVFSKLDSMIVFALTSFVVRFIIMLHTLLIVYGKQWTS